MARKKTEEVIPPVEQKEEEQAAVEEILPVTEEIPAAEMQEAEAEEAAPAAEAPQEPAEEAVPAKTRKKRASSKKKAPEEEPEAVQEPAEPKTPEEKLAELIEKGKKKGRLTTKELECLEELGLEGDAIEKFYDALEANSIEIVAGSGDVDLDANLDDVIPLLDDDLLTDPDLNDMENLEEITEEEMQGITHEFIRPTPPYNIILSSRRTHS